MIEEMEGAQRKEGEWEEKRRGRGGEGEESDERGRRGEERGRRVTRWGGERRKE